jgi:hypothetical protein
MIELNQSMGVREGELTSIYYSYLAARGAVQFRVIDVLYVRQGIVSLHYHAFITDAEWWWCYLLCIISGLGSKPWGWGTYLHVPDTEYHLPPRAWVCKEQFFVLLP